LELRVALKAVEDLLEAGARGEANRCSQEKSTIERAFGMSRNRGFPSVFPSGGREAASVTAAIALATVLIVSAVCGPRGPMGVGSPASFTDKGATQFSGYEGHEPKIEMEKRGDLWFVTVYQGQQQSGGYTIRVERAVHLGTGMRLRARFTTPPVVARAPALITSPAHTISFPFGADGITLYDQDDQKRAESIRP
jgi:hypothetical protein